MAEIRRNYHKFQSIKGISPVIATILMVMITVILVAFSYTWMQGMTSSAQESSSSYMDATDKQNQQITISTLYGNSTGLYFEIKALTSNKYNLDMNDTSYYLEDIPRTPEAWNGDGVGTSCVGANLAPGAKCYGRISGITCTPGHILKVVLGWGNTAQSSVGRCN